MGYEGQNSEGERQSLLCSIQNSVSKMSLAPRHKKQKKIPWKKMNYEMFFRFKAKRFYYIYKYLIP